MPSTIS